MEALTADQCDEPTGLSAIQVRSGKMSEASSGALDSPEEVELLEESESDEEEAMANHSVGSRPHFRVCGNFCGPWWSNGQTQRDVYTIDNIAGPTDGSCADECCRIHDGCCAGGPDGTASRAPCNRAFLNCLDACPWFGQKCKRGPGFYITDNTIALPFRRMKNRCCSRRCPVPDVPVDAATEEAEEAADIERIRRDTLDQGVAVDDEDRRLELTDG